MRTLLEDLRYAARMLLKNPGITAVAVLTLALGVGANTAIFSMVDWIMLRPLPVKDPQQLTVLAFQQGQAGFAQNTFSVAEYRDMRSQLDKPFSDVLAYQIGMDGLSENGRPDRVVTTYVSGNFFSGLGLQPAVGRLILPSEGETAGDDPIVVLGYAYWQRRYGGDPGVVGRKISVDGHPVTIVGVAPKGFHGLHALIGAEAFLPVSMSFLEGNPSDFMVNRQIRNMIVLGRLRPETSLEQARAAAAVVGQRFSQEHPTDEKDWNLQVYPELRARPNPTPSNTVAIVAAFFLGLAAMVLLLACANVANILLVRATVREREMAIRAAMGAARSRLIRQLLTESVLLAVVGGLAGILVGRWGSAAISAVPIQTDLPLNFDFSIDWRVFAYSFGAALVTGIIVGIVPALRASRGNLSSILHGGGRGIVGGKHRLRNGLVVAQVAGSLMLLIIAGLFMRSLGQVQKTDLGFNPDHLVNMAMDPNEIGYKETQGLEFFRNLLDRVRALPGVESATIASAAPMSYYGSADTIAVEGYHPPPDQPPAPVVNYNAIATDYLKTMGIPLLRGRTVTSADTSTSLRVAVINEAMAKRFWPEQEAIGRKFAMGFDPKHPIEVVGVVKDARYQGLIGPINAYFYVPLEQNYSVNSLSTLQVRTAGAPAQMIPVLRHTLQTLAPDLPVFDVKTMTEALDTLNGLLFFELAAGLAAVFGALGLTLAVVGVYGVISFATNQKTHEIGVRMALGAQRADVLKLIFGQGLTIVAIGLGVGLVAALGVSSLIGKFFTVSATDPATYISVSLFLALVALLACHIPARRAMRVDPMVALRYE
ncbi:MAG: ABC transporter permease [Candidatus Acidiferrales bacterium]